jgi:hypothetical protein
MNKLPIVTSLSDVEIKKIYGQSIFDYYQQIRKLFSSQSNLEYLTTFFAEPSINKSRQEISWYTSVDGEIIPVGSLSDDERIVISTKLSSYYKDIIKISDDLISVQGAKSLGSDALKAMLVTPRISESLFLIGDRLVLTEWGCIPFGSLPEVYDLLVQDKKYHNVIAPPVIVLPSVPDETTTNIDSLQPTPSQPELDTQETDLANETAGSPETQQIENNTSDQSISKPIPWWLWWREAFKWLLLLMLILLLLYEIFTKTWYIRNLESNVNIIDNKSIIQNDIANLWNQVDELLSQCGKDLSSDQGNIFKESIEPQTAETSNRKSLNDVPMENQPENDVKKDNAIKKENPKGAPTPPVEQDSVQSNIINPEAHEEMRFPKNRKDLSFLEGCWKSSTPIADASTNIPLEARYCFDGNKGIGQFFINLSDGNKCTSPLQAKRQGKVLLMTYANMDCAKGHFPPAKIICHQENSIALCNHIDVINGRDEPVENQVTGARFLKLDED